MIRSTLLQTFAVPPLPQTRLLRTRFVEKEVFVGCCVAVQADSAALCANGEHVWAALQARCGEVRRVSFSSALECPIRFHQELAAAAAGTALCFVFPDAATLQQVFALLRPHCTEGVLQGYSFVPPLPAAAMQVSEAA
ncbi:MAG: hypothetical protein GAK31_01002 [Stenotrophomonas maltophilia]|uniref:Uncharacterized protein n=1 Tax=Stenotrophomonas maltophilia TaxID=40324 RepID=A0A7V8FGN3_STEMA|nr:MAG: hypothetical protein GAK31_01002 [Stenotrophomonas maltophilia]